MKAPLPPDEEARLQALRSYKVLDTPPEQEFDDIALLASHICGTPIASITLIDENRQWFKSKVGLTVCETSRDIAFCSHTILQPNVLVVADARTDERFASNPLVTGDLKIRFYAGAPLINSEGHALGTLCVIDQVPHELSEEQKTALQALSRQVVAQLELRRSSNDLRQTVAKLQETQKELLWKTAFFEAEVDSSVDGILVVDSKNRKILQNKRTNELWKIPQHLIDDKDDWKQIEWVTSMIKLPERFVDKIKYLMSHPGEVSQDEIELKDGTLIERYSSPVLGKDGTNFGRIWTFHDATDRRRIEHELKDAKVASVLLEGAQRYNFLADTVPLIIWTARPDGNLDYYNKQWYDYTGLTLEQTKDWGWGAVVHPDDLQPCVETWKRSIASGENYEIEYRFKRGVDGAYRWFLGRATARRTEEGEILQWVGTCTDIDDHRRAVAELHRVNSDLEVRVLARTSELAGTNEALRGEIKERSMAQSALKKQQIETRFNEQRYRSLVEATTAIVWDTPASGEFETEQPSWTAFTGQSFEELRGYGWLQAVHPDDQAETLREWSSAVANQSVYAIEHRLKSRNGDYRHMVVRAVPILADDGTVLQLIGIHTDITDRKKTNESLRLLSSAIEQSKESILITDADLDLPGPRIIFANPAFTVMTGYSAHEVMGKSPRFLQGPKTDKAVMHRLRSSLEHGEVFAGEVVNYRKDGSEFILEWQIAPLRDGSKKITHFVAIQHDITKRKNLEAQLFQSQKMETVGKLAGGVAHEFNSILTAIIGQSELLLRDLSPASPLTRNATEINRAALRAATLTRQLLAYGRKQLLQVEVLDLNLILTGMDVTLRHLMGENTDVRIVLAGALKAVKADAGQMEQVILNIAINAHDAMPNGGKLTLETANVFLDRDSVGRYPELAPGNYVMLAITDTGIGISPEVQARVFEPFFSTKNIGQGTGLGLSTCYGIIKQSGGHIGVYSELGKGSTFKIYLPQVEQNARSLPQTFRATDMPRGTETILLVEDDAALRRMATSLLVRLGYTVLTAADGAEAVTLQEVHGGTAIDLLFTDVVMPHMSGKELSERVSALSPNTKILFTSAYTENAIVHQGVLDKGVALLQKPFTPSALAHKLREVLDEPIQDSNSVQQILL